MNTNIYLNFIATALLAALIFFGIVFVNAVDRVHFDNQQLLERITALESKLNSGNFTTRETQPEAAGANSEIIANREFFDPKAQSGGRIIGVSSSDTQNMNHLINNDHFASVFNSLTGSQLATRNYKNIDKFEPLMADSWTISEDKKVYHIKLRKGIYWHDFTDPVSGKVWRSVPVTAHDFKFFVDVVKDPDTNCAPLRVYMKDLEKIEVVNDYEFKVYWRVRYYLSREMTLGLSPLPRHFYAADGKFNGKKFNTDHRRNRMLIGCGAYRFDRWEKGKRVVFKRNENYFGRKYGAMPAIENIVYEIIKHPNTQFQALLSKKVDRFWLTPEQWVKRTGTKEFGKNGFLRRMTYPGRRYLYIGYNQKNPLFKDKRVRIALTRLVNRERILEKIFHGLGKIISGPFFYKSKNYDQSIKPYKFDVKKAKKLLAAAGWRDTDDDGILDKGGKKFEFTIMQVTSSTTMAKMFPIIKEDMEKAGIVMNIRSLEWSVYLKRLEEKKFEACCLAWTLPLGDGDPYQLWHSSEADKIASSNHISFKNAEADRIIERLRVCFDKDERLRLYHRFHKLMHEEQPYTFLLTPDNLLAISKRYRNVHRFPGGIPDDIIWTPKTEQMPVR